MGRVGGARRGVVAALVATLSMVVVVAIPSCSSSDDSFDRDKAVEAVMAQNGGQLTRAQAECYVDRVVHDLGAGALDTSTEPPPERLSRLTSIQIDCIGVVNLGTAPRGTMPALGDDTDSSLPRKLGDDPYLDRLYRACAAGSGPACDQLFDEAPLGSDYEDFASTCGGRTRELSCTSAYPDPTWSAPPTTHP